MMAPTQTIQKNIPFKLLDAVVPSNALESAVFGLPTIATFIEVVASLSAAIATETVTVSVYGAESLTGPFVLIDSALVPANATNIVQSFAAFVGFTHIKVVLSSVTIVSSTITVTVNAKDSAGLLAGGSFSGNVIPGVDSLYTIGSDSFGWESVFIHTNTDGDATQGLFLKDGVGDPIAMYPYADGSFEIDTSATAFYVDNGAGQFDFYGDGGLNILGAAGGIPPITSITGGVNRRIQTGPHWAVTGGSQTDQYVSYYTNPIFGYGGVAQKGTMLAFAGDSIIAGSGDATNEFAGIFSGLSMDIGAGFTQTTAPTGNIWGIDAGVHGPIALQNGLLGGITQAISNYFNGSPLLASSSAIAAVTYPGVGAGMNATHAAGTTFPINHGIYIGGKSGTTASPTGIGFTTALQIGGAGSNWQIPSSLIGTGINIRDYATAGININNATAVTAPSIIFDTFIESGEMASAPAAPAANGWRIYGVDNGGKTEVLIKFNSGSPVRVAIQP